MKIKNIRQYRTFYKNTIRKSYDRNEHHIGTYYYNEKDEKLFGWFELYHGDKEGYGDPVQGIRNFLQSFLDMAKDGQAVYEFLQNAVDAGASHFTMAWGKDEIDGNNYVLIANNGKMFDFDSVRSILNVGSSTKIADSLSIGKFGIGFKLAHRLVGKENGLDELLSSNPSGPILFSWSNSELFELAKHSVVVEPEDIDIHEIKPNAFEIHDNNPWLFKILITCFPVLPENSFVEEEVFLTNGAHSYNTAFSKSEIETLKRWVAKYSTMFEQNNYNEGSLFFIKLGVGKENDLADNNLGEGVRFSLAILQETAEADQKQTQLLHTVQLNNDKPIHKPELFYHFFKITKKEHTKEYIFIRFGVEDFEQLTSDQKNKFNKEDDIEVLIGFRDFEEIGDYFKGAPNFYLYFPLSEEVHNFNFILHSNAFYKASSRTFLHRGTQGEDGINERLLRVIAQRLEIELQLLYDNKDYKKFLNLYAALLTSSESQNHERQWIKRPFIDEITKVLCKLVPIRHSLFDPTFTVEELKPQIKLTSIEVPIKAYSTTRSTFNWFYWSYLTPKILIESAKHKLSLLFFDIYQLLIKPDIHSEVNKWIVKDVSRIQIILSELQEFDKAKDTFKSEFAKTNLKSLKLFHFSDGQIFNDVELVEHQNHGYVVLFKKLHSINDLLLKIGLRTTVYNLDDYDFFRHYSSYLNSNNQLRNLSTVINIISNANIEILNSVEKHQVFTVLRDMLDDRKRERLGELKLFKNAAGECAKIKNLLKSTEYHWLKPFVIHEEEQSKEIEFYLESDESNYFEHIIIPFWNQIGSKLIQVSNDSKKIIINEIDRLFKLNKSNTKNITETTHSIFFKNELIQTESPYFHRRFTKLNAEFYENMQDIISKFFDIKIPDFSFVTAYELDAFKFNSDNSFFKDNYYNLTFEEVDVIIKFSNFINYEFFKQYSIQKEHDVFNLIKGRPANYYAPDNKVIDNYINQYHSNLFIKLPAEFKHFGGFVHYQNDNLYEELVEKGSINSLDRLIEVILPAGTGIKVALLTKLNKIHLIIDDDDISPNKSKLTFLSDIISSNEDHLQAIYKKVELIGNNTSISLALIDSANDQINIDFNDIQIELSRNKLLNLGNHNAIPTINKFAQLAINESYLTEKIAYKLFKISNETISDELLKKVLEAIENQENRILNLDQLLLLIAKYEESNLDFSQFKIKTHNNNWVPFNGNFIVQTNDESADWFNSEKILSFEYNDIFRKLAIRSNELIYYANEYDVILREFTFQQGIQVEVLKKKENSVELLDYLFGQWVKTPEKLRIEFHNSNWVDLLDFDPKQKVLGKHVLNEETFDDSINTWLTTDTNSKIDFLHSIGVNTASSAIVKLREWLINPTAYNTFTQPVNEIPLQQLSNTLVGLADGFLNTNTPTNLKIDSTQFHILEKIIVMLLKSKIDYEFRVPIWVSMDKVCLGDESQGEYPKYINDTVLEVLRDGNNTQAFQELISNYKIIYTSANYKEAAENSYYELNTEIAFNTASNPIEHNEPFYSIWSQENQIKLIRCDELIHSLNVKNDNDEVELSSSIKSFTLHVQKDSSDYKTILYQNSLTLEQLVQHLSQNGYQNESEQVELLIQARDKMLSAFYHAVTSTGRDDIDSEDLKKIQEVLKERDLDEKRKELSEEIKSDRKYSYSWFISYIRYLLTFEELAKTTTQKTIAFQRVEQYIHNGIPSNKYLYLRSANSIIPTNIESFENFSITLIFYNRRKETLVVEGVSKKGQDLLVYIPNGIPTNLIAYLKRIVNITISFSPVLDLLQRLYSAFTNNEIISPWENIEESLPPLHFIYGPPGTGKTTKLVNILNNAFQNKFNLKALILVPTNKAGDVLAKRLIQTNEEIEVIRIGGPTDPELEFLNNQLYQSSLNENKIEVTNVVISTIHRLPYFQISSDSKSHFKLFDSESIHWDYIIFDESSMISIPYLTFALHALKHGNQILIAGDPKQIPAVIDVNDSKLEDLDLVDESIYKILQIESFNPEDQILRELDSIENLDTQFRSVPAIGNLFSTISYNSLLKHGRDFTISPIKQLPQQFYPALNSPIAFIDLPINESNSIMEPKKLLYSSYHVYASILTTELILNLDKSLSEDSNISIGVISPYKAQALLMNKLITSSQLSEKVTIYCDTVHGFQGDECDIVIFVINPNNRRFTNHRKSLLAKDYIYNVAISRAKDYLWIISPHKTITNNHHVNRLMTVSKNNHTIISADELEQYLFNDPNFISTNSYLTGHDQINVFSPAEMSYFIKAGTSAIDIQIRTGEYNFSQ